MDSSIDNAHLGGFTPERKLTVVALQVVQAVDTLFVQYCQSFVQCPSEADNLALVPLRGYQFGPAKLWNSKITTLKSSIGSPAGEYIWI